MLSGSCIPDCNKYIHHMSNFFASILSDQSATAALLRQGEKFGVHILKYGSSEYCGNVLTFGNVVIEELPDEVEYVPKGYEDSNLPQHKTFCQDITISCMRTLSDPSFGIQVNSKIAIKEFHVFPIQASNDQPTLALERSDSLPNNINERYLELNMDSVQDLKLKFKIPFNFEGHIHRFIIFRMEISEQLDLFSTRSTCFYMGLQIIGSAIHAGIDKSILPSARNNPQLLSVEAKPFIPVSCATYFDQPVHYTIDTVFLYYFFFLFGFLHFI